MKKNSPENDNKKNSFINKILKLNNQENDKNSLQDKKQKMGVFWFIKYVLKGALLILFSLSFSGYLSMLVMHYTKSIWGGIALFVGLLILITVGFILYKKYRKKK